MFKNNAFFTLLISLHAFSSSAYGAEFPVFILNDFGQEANFSTAQENLSTIPNSEINLPMTNWFTTLLPYSLVRRSEPTPYYISPLIFQRFADVVAESMYESYIFSKIEEGDNGEFLRLTLRDGVEFYKQTSPVNSPKTVERIAAKPEDVCFSLDASIENFKFSGRGFIFEGNVDSCEITGANEVTINMTSRGHLSRRIFANILTSSFFLPKSEYGALLENPESLNAFKSPVGTGPYVIESSDSQNLTYAKIENHWFDSFMSKRPLYTMERVTIKKFFDNSAISMALTSSDIDQDYFTSRKFVDDVVGLAKDKNMFRVDSIPTGLTRANGIRINSKRVSSKKVRKALSLILGVTDTYGHISEITMDSTRTTRLFPNTRFTNAPELPTESMIKTLGTVAKNSNLDLSSFEGSDFLTGSFTQISTEELDIEELSRERIRRALGIMKEAGYEINDRGQMVNSSNNKPLVLEVIVSTSAKTDVLLADQMRRQLKTRLGVDLRVVAVDPASFFNLERNHDFDLVIYGFPAGGPHFPYAGAIKGSLHSANVYSYGLEDPVLDALTERITQTGDVNEIRDITNLIERRVLSEYYFIPLYQDSDSYLISNKSRIQGPSYRVNEKVNHPGASFLPAL